MRRLTFAAAFGLCLSAGTVLMVFGSSAQEPIETLTLLQQRLEGLPEGVVCWDIRRGSLAPGMSSPATGNHVHGLVVSYVFDGLEYFSYEDGRSDTVGPGQAALFEADTPHRHDSVGTVPRSNVGFEMTCEPQPNSIGNTGNLPVRSGAVQHEIQVRERIWQPGARTPVHVLSGPTATLVLEGTIQTTSAARADCFGPGEIYVSPVGIVAQNSNVGNVPARTLDVDLWPPGAIRSVPRPEDRLVPSAISPSCPLR